MDDHLPELNLYSYTYSSYVRSLNMSFFKFKIQLLDCRLIVFIIKHVHCLHIHMYEKNKHSLTYKGNLYFLAIANLLSFIRNCKLLFAWCTCGPTVKCKISPWNAILFEENDFITTIMHCKQQSALSIIDKWHVKRCF